MNRLAFLLVIFFTISCVGFRAYKIINNGENSLELSLSEQIHLEISGGCYNVREYTKIKLFVNNKGGETLIFNPKMNYLSNNHLGEVFPLEEKVIEILPQTQMQIDLHYDLIKNEDEENKALDSDTLLLKINGFSIKSELVNCDNVFFLTE